MRVGGKVVKQRKMLQLWVGSEEVSWGKSDKKEKNTTIGESTKIMWRRQTT